MAYVLTGSQFHREVTQIEFEETITTARNAHVEHPDLERRTSLRDRNTAPLIWADIQEMREVSEATRNIRLALALKTDSVASSPAQTEDTLATTAKLKNALEGLQGATQAIQKLIGGGAKSAKGEVIAEDLVELGAIIKALHKDKSTKSATSQLVERVRFAQKSFALVEGSLSIGGKTWSDQSTLELAQKVREAHADLLRGLDGLRQKHAKTHNGSEAVDEKNLHWIRVRIALPSLSKDFRDAVLAMMDTYVPNGNVTCH